MTEIKAGQIWEHKKFVGLRMKVLELSSGSSINNFPFQIWSRPDDDHINQDWVPGYRGEYYKSMLTSWNLYCIKYVEKETK